MSTSNCATRWCGPPWLTELCGFAVSQSPTAIERALSRAFCHPRGCSGHGLPRCSTTSRLRRRIGLKLFPPRGQEAVSCWFPPRCHLHLHYQSSSKRPQGETDLLPAGMQRKPTHTQEHLFLEVKKAIRLNGNTSYLKSFVGANNPCGEPHRSLTEVPIEKSGG